MVMKYVISDLEINLYISDEVHDWQFYPHFCGGPRPRVPTQIPRRVTCFSCNYPYVNSKLRPNLAKTFPVIVPWYITTSLYIITSPVLQHGRARIVKNFRAKNFPPGSPHDKCSVSHYLPSIII
jgi:hypothetical protein